MKNLKGRIAKIEKLKKTDDDGFGDFLSRCVDSVAGATRGLPSQPRGLSPEKEEEMNQLFRDYPELRIGKLELMFIFCYFTVNQ